MAKYMNIMITPSTNTTPHIPKNIESFAKSFVGFTDISWNPRYRPIVRRKNPDMNPYTGDRAMFTKPSIVRIRLSLVFVVALSFFSIIDSLEMCCLKGFLF